MHSSHHRAHPWVGVGYVLGAAALFAVNGTVSKIVLQGGLSSLRLVEIRCLGAALLFAAIAAARRPASLRIGARELAFLAVYGVIGLAMVQWLYLVAITRMPVSVSLLIEFTAPLMVALWVRYVRREQVSSQIWLALALVLGGLGLVARVWAGLTLNGVGLLCAGLAAVALAAYYLLGERGLADRDPWSLAAWSFGAAAAFWALAQPWWTFPFEQLAVPLRFGAGGGGAGGGPELPGWALVGWVIVMGTLAPFGLVLAALTRIGATRVGLIGTAEPPLAGLVAWLAIGETLVPVQVVGSVVVLAGIALAEVARSGQPTAAVLPPT
jgi:drug/metabolite transporter (DMT)-like permease